MAMNTEQFLKKARAIVVKGLPTARNIAFSRLDIWPVRRLRSAAIRDIPVYCVSLVREQHRRRTIERQMEGLGFSSFSFIDALVAKDLDLVKLDQEGVYNDAEARRLHGVSLTQSQVSCSLSHGLAYQKVVEDGHEIALIIEDDALFLPAQLNRIELGDLPAKWDIAFLNSFIENGRPRKKIANNLYEGDAYTGSAAAYFVSRTGAKRLMETHKPVVNAADGHTGRNDIVRLMYYPDCVLNGSVCYYYNSSIAFNRRQAV